MMEMYTPGPWFIEKDESGTFVGRPEQMIAMVYKVVPVDYIKDKPTSTKANASLIAAAPELLKSLKDTLRCLESHLNEERINKKLKHWDDLCICNQNEVRLILINSNNNSTLEVKQAKRVIAKAQGE